MLGAGHNVGMREFIGRAEELGRLRRMVDDGLGGVGLVIGPAGVGKTALVDELRRSMGADGCRVLRGRAVVGDRRLAWWEQVGRALNVTASAEDLALTAAERELELSELLAQALRETAPALLVLEDAHLADESSTRMLADILDDLVGVNMSVVVTSRSREPVAEIDSRIARCELILLQPFDSTELATMFESARNRPPSEEELTALKGRTGGIPLLVREMLVGASAQSPAVRDVIAESISRVTAEVSSTLSLLALTGPGTPPVVLATAANSTPDRIAIHLAEARAAGLVDGESMWFRHDLFAEAASDRLDDADRRAAHAALASAWASVGGSASDRAARHLLLAVPAVAVNEAVAAACDAASMLCDRGRPGDAADLLGEASNACTRQLPSPSTSVRLLLALGEARWLLGDTPAALETFGRADAEAIGLADAELAASAAVAAHRRHNPFVPDPGARARLAELDRALGDRDLPIRVELLGRRSVLARQPPSDPAAADELAIEALAMARRLNDPALIVGALRDRFVACRTPEQLDERRAAAAEIQAIARREGSGDWLLVGYEWTSAGRLETGDLGGAARAVAELEATATVMRSAQWRMAALLRRGTLLALTGDRDGALELAFELGTLVESAAAPHEVVGAQVGLRSSVASLYGEVDPGLPELLAAASQLFDVAPSSFVQMAQATGSILLGDLDAARRRAAPWLADPTTAFDGPSPLNTLSFMAECVVELSLPDNAPPLIELLEPFRGRNATDLGTHVDLPIDYRLAGLEMLIGEHQRAVTHALAAVELGRRMTAPPIEARSLALLADAHVATGDPAAAVLARDRAEAIAEPIGLILDPPWRRPTVASSTARTRRDRPVVFRERTDQWRIDDGPTSFEVASTRGMAQLLRLIAAPGAELSAVELAGHHDAGAIAADAGLGPTLDARAKREYRNRIMELNADIEDADAANDLGRAEQSRLELDAVMDELQRATGLGGRDRPQHSGTEKARVNVTRNLRRAIAAIHRQSPYLGAHLRVSIRTGNVCSYHPDPSSTITITVER